MDLTLIGVPFNGDGPPGSRESCRSAARGRFGFIAVFGIRAREGIDGTKIKF